MFAFTGAIKSCSAPYQATCEHDTYRIKPNSRSRLCAFWNEKSFGSMARLKLFESIQNLLWSVSFMLTYWWFDDRAGGVAVAAAELALLASHSVGAVAVAAYSWPYSSVVRHWHWYAVVAAVPCDGCDGAAVASHADAAIFCASSSNMLSNVVFVAIVTYTLQSEEATNKLFTIILIIE